MKTLAMLLCAAIVAFGYVLVLCYDNANGVIVSMIGAVAFLLIASPRRKRSTDLYDYNAE
jgi:uncharacterized YccA/Bax inhibitor family protein